MQKPTKSDEFLTFIQGYMLRYATKRLKDFDKAEDVVQAAWVEALKTVDFSRSDSKVRDYMINAVKYIIMDNHRRVKATATCERCIPLSAPVRNTKNDCNNSDLLSLVEFTGAYDPAFVAAEVDFDVRRAIEVATKKFDATEKKFINLIIDGIPPVEAAQLCGHAPEERWGYWRLNKIKESFLAKTYISA